MHKKTSINVYSLASVIILILLISRSQKKYVHHIRIQDICHLIKLQESLKLKNILFDTNKTRLTLVKSMPGMNFNWLFLPGGPGIDSGYLHELISLLSLPGNIWSIDLPQNGSNIINNEYQPGYDFDQWGECLILPRPCRHSYAAFLP
jgi:hypothetical protein